MQEPYDEEPRGVDQDGLPAAPTPYSVNQPGEIGLRPSAIDVAQGADFGQPTINAGAVQRSQPAPRIWPVVVIAILSGASFMLCSMVMLVVSIFIVHGEFTPRMMVSGEAMRAVSADRVGLLLLVIVPQLALVMPSLLAAYFSPVPMTKRLSLVRGHWPLWAWVAAAATTPLIGWISSVLIGSLMEESENLKMMSDIFRGHGESGFLIPLAFLIGATPAFCEELLFRGYVQTRLNRRIGPALGILLSSAAFALFHIDVIHVIAVFPLGVYLGIVAWRSGSLIPAMLGHFVNNSISVFAVVLGPESMDQTPTPEMAVFLLGVLGTGLVGAAFTAFAMWRLPVPKAPALVTAQ